MMRPNPTQELTDEENERILGTLTHEAWVGLSVEAIAADWYDLDTDLSALLKKKAPSVALVKEARISSGSIEGAHRRDLKEALIGAPQAQSNLSVPIAVNPPQEAPPQQPPKRGFGR